MNTRKSYPGEFPDEGRPIDHLSSIQLEKGSKILQELEVTLNQNSSKEDLLELSNKYYTVIPHKFSRGHSPPIIASMDQVEQEKKILQDSLSQQQS